MNAHYADVARRARHRCEYCRAPEVVFNCTFEVEHVRPVALGGADELSNYALACRSCNGHKGAAVLGPDPDTGENVPLCDPRTEVWAEHFRYDLDCGRVDGVTATVARLDLNSVFQLAARPLWVQLRLFP